MKQQEYTQGFLQMLSEFFDSKGLRPAASPEIRSLAHMDAL